VTTHLPSGLKAALATALSSLSGCPTGLPVAASHTRAVPSALAVTTHSFQEARQYLGVDGQRHWNDAAVARTTPARFGLYSLVALIVQRQPAWQHAFRQSAWYQKARPTFVDALAQVRRALWRQLGFWLSEAAIDRQKSAPVLFEHFAELLAYVA
jgi:hypothetical protein